MTQLTLEAVAARLDALERKVAELAPPDDPPGTVGDEQPDDPDAVARWLAAFDAIPPLNMSADEEAAWRSARAEQQRIDAAARDRFAVRSSGGGA